MHVIKTKEPLKIITSKKPYMNDPDLEKIVKNASGNLTRRVQEILEGHKDVEVINKIGHNATLMSNVFENIVAIKTCSNETFLHNMGQVDHLVGLAGFKTLSDLVEYLNVTYEAGRPVVADSTYDRIFEILKREIDIDESTRFDKVEKVGRTVPMTTLNRVYDNMGAEVLLERTIKRLPAEMQNRARYLISNKFDGVPVSLVYEDCKLVQASTRGDGYVGKDITDVVKLNPSLASISKERLETICKGEGLDLKKFDKFEMRGELIFTKTDFTRIRHAMRSDNLISPPSVRVMVNDIINDEEGKLRERFGHLLTAPIYELVNAIDYGFKYYDQVHEFCKFIVHDTDAGYAMSTEHHGERDAAEIISSIDGARDVLFSAMNHGIYPTDGVVYHINDLEVCEFLDKGKTIPHSRFAYKETQNVVETRVTGVDFNVSRNGFISPVIKYNKVGISDYEVAQTALHDYYMFAEQGFRHGDIIELANDRPSASIRRIVIRNEDEEDYGVPSCCPECGSDKLIYSIPDSIWCVNPSCKVQATNNIQSIKGALGIKIQYRDIIGLVNRGIVKNAVDLLTLGDLPWVSTDEVPSRVLEALKETYSVDFYMILSALNIPRMSEKRISILADMFTDLKDFVENVDKVTEHPAFVLDVGDFVVQYATVNQEYLLCLHNSINIVTTEEMRAIDKAILDERLAKAKEDGKEHPYIHTDRDFDKREFAVMETIKKDDKVFVVSCNIKDDVLRDMIKDAGFDATTNPKDGPFNKMISSDGFGLLRYRKKYPEMFKDTISIDDRHFTREHPDVELAVRKYMGALETKK